MTPIKCRGLSEYLDFRHGQQMKNECGHPGRFARFSFVGLVTSGNLAAMSQHGLIGEEIFERGLTRKNITHAQFFVDFTDDF